MRAVPVLFLERNPYAGEPGESGRKSFFCLPETGSGKGRPGAAKEDAGRRGAALSGILDRGGQGGRGGKAFGTGDGSAPGAGGRECGAAVLGRKRLVAGG